MAEYSLTAGEGQHACITLQKVHETEAAGCVQGSRPAGNVGTTWAAERASCRATGPDPLLATLSTVTAAVDASGLPGRPFASLRLGAMQPDRMCCAPSFKVSIAVLTLHLMTSLWGILTVVAPEGIPPQICMLPLHFGYKSMLVANGYSMISLSRLGPEGGLLGSATGALTLQSADVPAVICRAATSQGFSHDCSEQTWPQEAGRRWAAWAARPRWPLA